MKWLVKLEGRYLDHENIIKIVLENEAAIVMEDGKLASKTAEIWKMIGDILNMKPMALYAFVANDKQNLKSLLLDPKPNKWIHNVAW